MSIASKPQWFKSSHSGGSGTECVECARTSSGALVRDSKNVSGPVVIVREQAWHAFTRSLRQAHILKH
ncbi:DUF397 domain-containing protein [Streptomyces sp. NPDC048420]|uniref:DUF397 domain-containing protein n=1 Tax=Streptomyces sp. NPDC048420 TaxID=3155755 RepID=UPI00342A0077